MLFRGKYMKAQYEKPKLEMSYFNNQDVLTESQESGFGDGWAKDPFEEE